MRHKRPRAADPKLLHPCLISSLCIMWLLENVYIVRTYLCVYPLYIWIYMYNFRLEKMRALWTHAKPYANVKRCWFDASVWDSGLDYCYKRVGMCRIWIWKFMFLSGTCRKCYNSTFLYYTGWPLKYWRVLKNHDFLIFFYRL